MEAVDRNSRGGGAAFLAGAAIASVVLVVGAVVHGVNPDEGFYLAAAWRSSRGASLYRDFFFPQMPYLPLMQGWYFRIVDVSLTAGRMFSAVPAALSGGVLATLVWRATRRWDAVALGVAAYVGHVLSWNYLTVVKTYGVANLTTLAALGLLIERQGRVAAAFAGVCAGIGIATRLPTLAVAGVLGLWLLIRSPRRVVPYAIGLAVSLLPCVWIALQDPSAFWFGNFEFHSLRREISGWGPVLRQKLEILVRWITVPQNTLLWLAAGFGVVRGDERGWLAGACAIALGALYLSATPTYLEYTIQLVPLLIVAAIPALLSVSSRRGVLVAAVCLYVVGLAVGLRPTDADSARGRKLDLWNHGTVDEVTAYIRASTSPDDHVLSWWEGYPILAQRPGYLGIGFWESNVAKKLDADARERYHLLGIGEIRALVEHQVPRLVVVAEGEWPQLRDALAGGYEIAREWGAVRIYRRRIEAATAGLARDS